MSGSAAKAKTAVAGFATASTVVRVGGEVSDRVTIKPKAVRSVTVQVRREGAARFRIAYAGRSNASGAFTAYLHPPSAGRFEYRLAVAPTKRERAAVTPVRTVVAKGSAVATRLLGLETAPATIVLGATLSDDIAVRPRARRTVEVWTRAPGAKRFALTSTEPTSTTGTYRVAVRPTTVGSWAVKVVVRASRTAAAVTSAARSITVASPPPPVASVPQAKPTAVLLVGGQWPPPSPPVVTLTLGFNFGFNFSASTPTAGHQLTKATLDLGTGGVAAVIPYVAGPSWYFPAPYSSVGTYKVTLTVTDTSGATSDPVSVTVVIVGPPTATIQVPAPVTVGVPVTIDLNPRTPAGTTFTGYDIDLYGAGSSDYISGQTPPETITRTFSRAGTVYVDVYLENSAGGYAYVSGSFTVVGDKTTAVLEVDWGETSPVEVTAGDDVWFWAGASFTTPNRTLVSGVLDFGDGTADKAFSGAPDTWEVQHAYGSPGTYTAELTVTDSLGGTSTATFAIHVFAPPTVSIELTGGAPVPGQQLTFAITSSTPAGTAHSGWYVESDIDPGWWSGDGAPPSALSMTCPSPGSYTVTVTVYNDIGGEASDTVEVVVS